MQSFSHRTEVKTLFLVLWFNCESRIEIDHEKWIKISPTDSRITFIQKFGNNHYNFPRKGREAYKALEVYIV